MDTINRLCQDGQGAIICIDMHTTGEPTRIVTAGHPPTSGTLLEQRAQCKSKYDHIRKRLMLEPAGHADMYGAILRPETELTIVGEAHIGVLFIHNEGYSTMCGHATIALGRFLLDTQDLAVFPRRNEIAYDWDSGTAALNLHAPCGLVRVTVPIMQGADFVCSDPSRPVSFVSVPSFATGRHIQVNIAQADRWPELRSRSSIAVSFCYGGAFTCLVSAAELGFSGLARPVPYDALKQATKTLKGTINANTRYQTYMTHPEHSDLSSLYTVIVVDKSIGHPLNHSRGAETGLCLFADQQVDRSPTGSAVAARIAYAYALGELNMGDAWTYHSLVSDAAKGQGGFVGTVLEEVEAMYDEKSMLGKPLRVRVEGNAYYIGSHVVIAEKEDPYSENGFLLNRL